MFTLNAVKAAKTAVVLLILALAAPGAQARQKSTLKWTEPFLQEQTQAIDYDKMDRDLRIMEKIISMVLSEEDLIYFKPQKVKGAYLEDYGVVFMVPMTSTTSFLRPVRSEKEQTVEESFIQIREILTDFASSYADAIKQIKPNDWITMVVNPSTTSSNVRITRVLDEFEVFRRATVVRESEGFKPFSFIISVRKSNITSYRDDAMNMEQFSEAVLYSPISAESEDYMTPKMQKDIEILRGILETVLEDNLNTSFTSESVQGTYLKDYGVLFTVNAGSAISLSTGVYDIEIKPPAIPEIKVGDITINAQFNKAKADSLKALQKLEQAKYRIEAEKLILDNQQKNLENLRLRLGLLYDQQFSLALQTQTEADKEKIEKLVDVLIGVIGDYGHTIRELKGNDQIAILFSSSGYRAGTSGAVNLMLTARYIDILDYSKGRITLDVFKSKVISRTFEEPE